jgi:hypothetical protein
MALMPRLVLEEPDFRIVETDITGDVTYVLEVRDGCDALGVERWRIFRLNNKTERDLFGYLLRITLKGE